MSQYQEMSEDEFADHYRPRRNHLDPSASFDFGDGYGTLFETFGPELAFICSQPVSHVWTLLSGDEGEFISSGFHRVNRLGYFVCDRPVPDGRHIEVALEPLNDDGDTGPCSLGGEHADFR